MTSKIKVDNIENQCGGAVVTKCGGTTTISGSVVKADDIQAADGGNLINQCGTTITLGASGDTINLASGASQTGFGRTGTVNWDTTPKTATFTAVNGTGYFVNTTSGGVTVNLPAGSAGAIVAVNDYAQTAATNNITIAANGSEKIQGSTNNHSITTNGVTATLVYVDSTQGWKLVDTGEVASLPEVALFTTATGGTITCCGDYKIHTFTSPGTFCVSQIGNAPTVCGGGPTTVSYLVIAGGANGVAGGGGAGGFREGRDIGPSYTASPLVAPTGLTIAANPYSVTVGAGGGNPSTFSTITSAGGGVGNWNNPGSPGGSGGGGGKDNNPGTYPGGSGNSPPVSPPQGQPGGTNNNQGQSGAGGGGAGGSGSPGGAGPGGNGVSTSITGSSVTRAGGGGGGNNGSGSSGGSGGGGPSSGPVGTNGTANTGGGGGGGYAAGSTGGSGIVIIRYKFQ